MRISPFIYEKLSAIMLSKMPSIFNIVNGLFSGLILIISKIKSHIFKSIFLFMT